MRRWLDEGGRADLKATEELELEKGLRVVPLRDHNLIVRHFKPALKRAKLPEDIRLYELRHSCATILLEQGEPPKVVAERLGHSSTGITLDTYSRVAATMQENASAKIANEMYGRRKSHSSHAKGKTSRKRGK